MPKWNEEKCTNNKNFQILNRKFDAINATIKSKAEVGYMCLRGHMVQTHRGSISRRNYVYHMYTVNDFIDEKGIFCIFFATFEMTVQLSSDAKTLLAHILS